MSQRQFPRATYRLQLNSSFTFKDVLDNLEFYKALGISHLYLSPCLQATSGSTHGYDVVNHNLLNTELGSRYDFNELCRELDEAGMGIILDIVPNHMAISGPENPWWWDVLENGPSSQHSRYFDVDWHHDSEDRSNLILLPILGNHYGIILENGELKLHHDRGKFTIRYYENIFPLAPRTIPKILELAYEKSDIKEIGYMANAFKNLPHASSREIKKIQQRQRDKAVLEEMLENLCQNLHIEKLIDQAVEEINSNVELLDEIIGKQSYKLAYWKLSRYQIGYRRFFNINSLVGLRMEDETVFKDSHKLVIELFNENKISGFRVDHPDGLYDPTGYFLRLRRACPNAPIYAEKILERHEKLNSDWLISGTTGYDFLNLANGLFIEKDGHQQLEKIWHDFTDLDIEFEDLVYNKKKEVINKLLGSEINRLATDLMMICENHRRYRDFAGTELFQAITEVATALGVYRTYIQPETDEVLERDTIRIENAIKKAKENKPELGSYIFDFFREILLLKLRGEEEDNFVRRFQQFTGPVMAKSLEDTVFYIYNPLTSANEVGGSPDQPWVEPAEFHQWSERMAHDWPLTMLASSTHDSKRSEDVRARINLLSEIPEEWQEALKQFSEINAKYKKGSYPDANTEYLLYQTLVGAWPISSQRISRYMEKAVREAKVHSSWFDPNSEFENALMNFIQKVLDNEDFIQALEKFVKPLIIPGRINSLAQLCLKLTAPGVPDIYQGTELWDNSLTDPDNRRPVDFKKRMIEISKIKGKSCREILFNLEEGLPKLYIIQTLLKLRKKYPEFNEPDSYKTIEVLGAKSDYLVAFMRGENVIVAIPRLQYSLKNNWGSTRIALPEGQWLDIFSQAEHSSGSVKVKELIKNFPVSVLIRNSEKD
ncbi:MAG: malto-oligosyltrehalose synthase [Candidatus Rifleibacteriota bacterium]